MDAPKAARRKATTGPVTALRRMLLLIPAAWKAGPEGLTLDKAVKITGASSPGEIEELVASVGCFDLGPSMPEDFLSVSIVGDRVVVDRGLHLVSPPALSLREGAALTAALRPFADGSGNAGGGKAVAAALRKLARAVPEPIRQRTDRLSRTMDFQIDPPGTWADSLAKAIESRLEVTIEYRAESVGTAGQRTLEPRVMFHQDGHWYLAAWNIEKGAEHLYRLDRITSVVLGTRVFGEHKGPPLERLRTKHLYFQSGGEREVKVRFIGSSAAQVVEQWPEQASRNEDGSVTVTARITLGNYLYGWVLGYGGQAEIESPAEARSALATRVEELKKLYADA